MSEHIEKLRLYRGEMSRADVLRAVECIDRNANELFEDARLLFDNGRYARALSLMLLAFEERTKAMLPVLYYSQQREPKSRTSFWKLYRSHNIKLEALFRLCGLWMLLTKEPLLENEVEWAAVQSDIFNLGGRYAEVATQANLVKQGGFYADCYEVEGVGVWTAPSDYYNNSAAK
jgi:AbiV family abortive infection protein